jgi:hypothetical protein
VLYYHRIVSVECFLNPHDRRRQDTWQEYRGASGKMREKGSSLVLNHVVRHTRCHSAQK